MAKQYVLTCDLCGAADDPGNQILRVYVLKVGRDLCRNDRSEFLKALGIDGDDLTDLLDQQEQDAASQRGRGRKPRGSEGQADAEQPVPQEGIEEPSEAVTEGDDKKPASRGRKGKTEEAAQA